MDNKTFEEILVDRFDKCTMILGHKADEYSSFVDRLHNFKLAKKMGDCPTKQLALWGMLTKHLVSMFDLCKNPKKANKEILDEKITDCINYFVLLEALFMEDL